jgi:hypothetical protein
VIGKFDPTEKTEMKMRITPSSKSITVAILFFATVIALRAGTITVTNTNDSGPGSLRQALADANDGDTIDFAVTGTITLTTGELLVGKSVTIAGPGADNLAVNGNAKSRVFHIGSGETATISGLAIRNGRASGDVYPDDSGGGLYNDHAALTLSNCTISDNSANADGGGIFNDGQSGTALLEISSCIFQDNAAGDFGSGGSIYNKAASFGNATVTLNNSTISGNLAATSGGGIYNRAEDSSATALVTVSNSTLSGNSAPAGFGGGIFNDTGTGNARIAITNSTLSDNSDAGGGNTIANFRGTVDISNNVLNATAFGNNFFNQDGMITSFGYNISSDDGGGFLTGPGDQINTDPLLGPLQDNGGPTLTHELLMDSPAIDAGDPGFTPPPLYDQRGPDFFRVRNGRLDIGSFEVQVGSTPTPTPSPTPTPRPIPTPRQRPTPHPRPAPR